VVSSTESETEEWFNSSHLKDISLKNNINNSSSKKIDKLFQKPNIVNNRHKKNYCSTIK
jgi:hypothetical protein